MNPFEIPLGWLLGGAVVVVLAWFGWVEYHAHLLKTRVTQEGGVLRFDAHGWWVEVRRSEQQLVVQARKGHLSQQALNGGAAQVQDGAIAVTLPAPGLRIEVQPAGASASRVVVQASDAMAFAAQGKTGGVSSVLRIEGVPAPVAVQFGAFANQLRVWVDKLEHRLAAEQQADAAVAEAARLEAEAAKAAAEGIPEVPKEALSAEAQVMLWRKAAGFAGTSSEIGLGEKGGVDWYVDLGPTGRITLHSGGRTAHTTLAGAEIVSLGGEIEVAVRAEDWTPDVPVMRRFRILTGRPPDERRAWKERLEILRDELRAAAGVQA